MSYSHGEWTRRKEYTKRKAIRPGSGYVGNRVQWREDPTKGGPKEGKGRSDKGHTRWKGGRWRGDPMNQYPDHVRTTPVMLPNPCRATNFVGKWGHRRQFCRKMRLLLPFSWRKVAANVKLSFYTYNKKHCIRNYLEYLVNIWNVSATWLPVKKKGNVPRIICHQ